MVSKEWFEANMLVSSAKISKHTKLDVSSRSLYENPERKSPEESRSAWAWVWRWSHWCHMLISIKKVTAEPIKSRSTYFAIFQFFQQWSMIYRVKCLFNVNKYSKWKIYLSIAADILFWKFERKISWMAWLETVLEWRENILFNYIGLYSYSHDAWSFPAVWRNRVIWIWIIR